MQYFNNMSLKFNGDGTLQLVPPAKMSKFNPAEFLQNQIDKLRGVSQHVREMSKRRDVKAKVVSDTFNII